MPPLKMPAYFEKYLNEKFDHVVEEINDVKDETKGIRKEVKKLNGCVRGIDKDVQKNRLSIKVLAGVIAGGSLIWIEESRNFIISIVKAVSGF